MFQTDITDPQATIFSAEVSPDGKTLAYTSQDTRNPAYSQPVVYIKSLPDGEPRAITSGLMMKTVSEYHRYSYHNWLYLAWSGRSLA